MTNKIDETVTIGEWVITYLILFIPLVNLIMIFVWAFGGGAKPSKANLFKALIIWVLVGLAISIVLFVVFGALIMGFVDSYL